MLPTVPERVDFEKSNARGRAQTHAARQWRPNVEGGGASTVAREEGKMFNCVHCAKLDNEKRAETDKKRI